MTKPSPTRTFLAGLVLACSIPTLGFADPKKDRIASVKAARALEREASNKCDKDPKHFRGPGYQADHCGHDLAEGCSISGAGASFRLAKLTNKTQRTTGASKRYPPTSTAC